MIGSMMMEKYDEQIYKNPIGLSDSIHSFHPFHFNKNTIHKFFFPKMMKLLLIVAAAIVAVSADPSKFN